jgi:ligand-binding sensor domain-containing protein
MSRFFVFSASLSCAFVHLAFSDEKIDAKSWRSVGKLDPVVLSTTLGDHAGKIIAVQFNFRGKNIHHMKSNWFEGSVWVPDANAKKGFSNIRVMVAKEDLAAFQSIPTDSTSATRQIVYGRVQYDTDYHYFFLRLFGRKATVDSAGGATITW